MRFDNRKNLNREVVEKIKEYFGDKLFNTLIRVIYLWPKPQVLVKLFLNINLIVMEPKII